MTIQTFLYAKRNSCVNFWELTYEWPSYLHGLKKMGIFMFARYATQGDK